jgi:predicted P-loop ATPase
MDDVWSEALHIYLSKNFKYWITAEDQVELEANNKSYINITQEHEYVSIYFTAPAADQRATHIAPASVLRDYISAETGNKNLKDRNIGVALSQLGFEQISHRLKDITYPIKAWRIILNNAGDNTLLFKYLNDEIETTKKPVTPVQAEIKM